MSIVGWLTGRGKAPAMSQAERDTIEQMAMPEARWATSGQYTLYALSPTDRFRFRMTLASMVGAEMLAVVHDMLTLAAGSELATTDFSALWAALRRFTSSGAKPDRQVVQQAAGALWTKALRRLYEVMPDEREMHLGVFLTQVRPFLTAAAPLIASINRDTMEDLLLQMLVVKQGETTGLYVAEVPCRDKAALNAMVGEDDLEAIFWWALLFNLRPFTPAGSTTSPSPGRATTGNTPTGRTR